MSSSTTFKTAPAPARATPSKPATATTPASSNFFAVSDTTFTWNKNGKNTLPVPLTSDTSTTTSTTTTTTTPLATTSSSAGSGTAINANVTVNQPFKFSPSFAVVAPRPTPSNAPVALAKIPPSLLPSKGAVRMHDSYYFSDGSVVIQVEDVLFNLHQSILTLHSKQKFVDLGLLFRTDNAPLVLKGVDLKDFECLLGVLYPQHLGIEEEKRTVNEWISIMKQAHIWNIEPLKHRAAKHLTTMPIDPSHRINLYQNCDMGTSQDLLPAFLHLCCQEESVGFEEACLLGLETFTKVVKIREMKLKEFSLVKIQGEKEKKVLSRLIKEDILGLGVEKAITQTALLEAPGSPKNESSPTSNSNSKEPAAYLSHSLSHSSSLAISSTPSSPSSPGSSADGLDDAVKVEKPNSDGDGDGNASDSSRDSESSDEA